MNHTLTQFNLSSYHEAQGQTDRDEISNPFNLFDCHWRRKLQGKALFSVSEHEDRSPGHLFLLGIYDGECRRRERFASHWNEVLHRTLLLQNELAVPLIGPNPPEQR